MFRSEFVETAKLSFVSRAERASFAVCKNILPIKIFKGKLTAARNEYGSLLPLPRTRARARAPLLSASSVFSFSY